MRWTQRPRLLISRLSEEVRALWTPKLTRVPTHNLGLESISCSDTGSEISHADALIACQRYTTSKIQTFSDLEYAPDPLYTSQEQSKFIWVSGSSFFISPSFRGEALNSICNASGSLVIQTRTAEEKCGREYTFDTSGNCVKNSSWTMQPGTTIICTRLFDSLPVCH